MINPKIEDYIKDYDFQKENREFCDKCELEGKTPTWKDIEFAVGKTMLEEEIKEYLKAVEENDIKEQIDGLCNIIVIVENLLYKLNKIFDGEVNIDIWVNFPRYTNKKDYFNLIEITTFDEVNPIKLLNLLVVLNTKCRTKLINITLTDANYMYCLKQVTQSNLSKLQPDGTVIKKDGKVQKPPTYFKPDFSLILKELGL